MRRTDREVSDINEIENILQNCKVCNIAMRDGEIPYLVPLNFAYEINNNTLVLFFHSAKEGRKIDVLRNNNTVCFDMYSEGKPVNAEKDPCNSGYKFISVIGDGKVEFINDWEEKRKALILLLKQQANVDCTFTKDQVEEICVFKIISKSFVGKKK